MPRRRFPGDVAPIRIAIGEPMPIVRRGLASLFAETVDMQVVAEADTARDLLELCRRDQPDVVLVDVLLASGDAALLIADIKEATPDAVTAVLTTVASGEIAYESLVAGA